MTVPLTPRRSHPQQLPIACIAKIMANELAKSNLGYNTKISNDAKRLVQECATEFICFIMSEANSQAREAGRTSVSGQQMIDACASMGAWPAPNTASVCPFPFGASCLTVATFGVPAGFDEMVGPMSHALPHLGPAKRKRKKKGEGAAPDKSKLPRVSGQASTSTEVSEEVC